MRPYELILNVIGRSEINIKKRMTEIFNRGKPEEKNDFTKLQSNKKVKIGYSDKTVLSYIL